MEELRRIDSPVKSPQPVGGGSRNQPGKRRQGDFRDILDRERDEDQDRVEKETPPTSESDDREAGEEKPVIDPDRGLLIDERA